MLAADCFPCTVLLRGPGPAEFERVRNGRRIEGDEDVPGLHSALN